MFGSLLIAFVVRDIKPKVGNESYPSCCSRSAAVEPELIYCFERTFSRPIAPISCFATKPCFSIARVTALQPYRRAVRCRLFGRTHTVHRVRHTFTVRSKIKRKRSKNVFHSKRSCFFFSLFRIEADHAVKSAKRSEVKQTDVKRK